MAPPKTSKLAPLAQLDRAFDYESKGQEFESLRARQLENCICRCGGMADAFDSKSNGETRGGSSPLTGTILINDGSLEIFSNELFYILMIGFDIQLTTC